MSRTGYIATFDESSLEEVGNKFHQLAIISRIVNVPDAVCIKNGAFKESLPSDSRQLIEVNLTMLHSNGGYRLNKIQREIEASLGNIHIPKQVLREIEMHAKQISRNWKHKVIVRSSSCFEDGSDSSGAGIYESVPDISNTHELTNAILHCWKASFSLTAIAHRLRIGEFGVDPLPGLILQRYIDADLSGVTFSQNPIGEVKGIFVEYTEGSSDGIESGTGSSKSFLASPKSGGGYVTNNHDLDSNLASQLVDVASEIKTRFKREMEYEWVYQASQLFILQARPITTLAKKNTAARRRATVNIYDLYLESEKINNCDLGEIEPIYQHSIKKRKQIRLFALENGVAINGSAVVIANRNGLNNIDLASQPSLNRLATPVLTIDLGPHLRSFYTTRAELKSTLQTLINSSEETPLIVREFASGDFSAVSMHRGKQTIVEVCRGSLIGINRGFVETETYSVNLETGEVLRVSGSLRSKRFYGFDDKSKTFTFLKSESAEKTVAHKALIEISNFNSKVNQVIGKNILEWTIIDGNPVYVDNAADTDSAGLSYEKGAMFISPGRIRGTVLRVEDLKKLEYISSGPTLNINGHLPTLEANKEIQELMASVENKKDIVVVSKFPYTALSVLVGNVKGFVFESGPILCHLAIISRENKTPVAIVGDALTRYHDGDRIDLA